MAGTPLVGVTIARGIWHSSRVPVHYTPEAYTRALCAADMIPLLIPATLDEAALRRIYERVDGILLTGGGDVHPRFSCFDAAAPETHHAADIDESRDVTEFKLTQWAFEDDKPLLGICRGVQVLNVALGGTLIMDIPAQVGTRVTHQEYELSRDRAKFLHEVRLEPQSCLATLVGNGQFAVNSIHHQAIDVPADRLCPTAYAPDGVIEAVEAPEKRFFLGVQWHPEEIYPTSPASQQLFQSFARSMRV